MYNYVFGVNILPIDLSYKNILRLNDELHALNIPHEFVRHLDGWAITYPDCDDYRNVQINKYTYGHENDLMWAHGFDDENDFGIGNLTVDEALKLFIRAWEADKNAERSSD